MILTRHSTLTEVALAAGAALSRQGIRAVLTGGACVSLHTDGSYVSEDVDFVIQNPRVEQWALDAALATVGFVRTHDRYVHPLIPFYIEFPPGPLSIGGDLSVRPIELSVEGTAVLILSPTDCCRDRLAAFYFWNDRQSLNLAVAVARRHHVALDVIRAWSITEGSLERFEEFLRQLSKPSA